MEDIAKKLRITSVETIVAIYDIAITPDMLAEIKNRDWTSTTKTICLKLPISFKIVVIGSSFRRIVSVDFRKKKSS